MGTVNYYYMHHCVTPQCHLMYLVYQTYMSLFQILMKYYM
jgi:hypothetical protein